MVETVVADETLQGGTAGRSVVVEGYLEGREARVGVREERHRESTFIEITTSRALWTESAGDDSDVIVAHPWLVDSLSHQVSILEVNAEHQILLIC